MKNKRHNHTSSYPDKIGPQHWDGAAELIVECEADSG